MSKLHTIEVYDSSDSHYKYYDTDDFEIDGHTLEEHDKRIRAEVIEEFIKLCDKYCHFYENKHPKNAYVINRETLLSLAEQLKEK